MRVIVDARTRIPVRWTIWWGAGRAPQEALVDAVTLDRAPARSTFTLRQPPADRTLIESGGFPDASGADLAYDPLPFSRPDWMRTDSGGMAAFPRWLPQGFRLSWGAASNAGTGVRGHPRPALRHSSP